MGSWLLYACVEAQLLDMGCRRLPTLPGLFILPEQFAVPEATTNVLNALLRAKSALLALTLACDDMGHAPPAALPLQLQGLSLAYLLTPPFIQESRLSEPSRCLSVPSSGTCHTNILNQTLHRPCGLATCALQQDQHDPRLCCAACLPGIGLPSTSAPTACATGVVVSKRSRMSCMGPEVCSCPAQVICRSVRAAKA